MERITQFLPAGADQLQSVVESTVTGFGPAAIVSIGFLLVSGTRVFAALARAINVFWSHVDDASWFRRQLSRAVLLLVVGSISPRSWWRCSTGAGSPGASTPPIAARRIPTAARSRCAKLGAPPRPQGDRWPSRT